MKAESSLKKCFHSKFVMFVQHSMMINAFNCVTLWHKLQYPRSLLLESGANSECLVLSAGPCICEAWIPFYNGIAVLISFPSWKGLPFPVIHICGNMVSHYIMALLKKIIFSWEQNSYSTSCVWVHLQASNSVRYLFLNHPLLRGKSKVK